MWENPSLSESSKPAPLEVLIKHEPFIPWVELHWEGHSEELEHDQALDWLGKRGARDMKAANEAICHAMNFGTAVFTILNPLEPERDDRPGAPNI